METIQTYNFENLQALAELPLSSIDLQDLHRRDFYNKKVVNGVSTFKFSLRSYYLSLLKKEDPEFVFNKLREREKRTMRYMFTNPSFSTLKLIDSCFATK